MIPCAIVRVVLARNVALLALVGACASTPRPVPSAPPPETPWSIADRYYCEYGADTSLLARPSGFLIPIDVDRSATSSACYDAQRRLDDASSATSGLRASDDALRRACLARRCVLWRVVAALSERDIIRLACTRDRLRHLDEVMGLAFSTRTSLDGASDRDAIARAQQQLEVLAQQAAQQRLAADDCTGERRAGGPR